VAIALAGSSEIPVTPFAVASASNNPPKKRCFGYQGNRLVTLFRRRRLLLFSGGGSRWRRCLALELLKRGLGLVDIFLDSRRD